MERISLSMGVKGLITKPSGSAGTANLRSRRLEPCRLEHEDFD